VIDQITVTDVFALRPDYVVALLEISGLPSGPSDEQSREQLERAAQLARADGADQHPHILAWREAFQAFGAKPKRTPPSSDALRRRLDRNLPAINRIVDIYNAVSIEHAIPIGGEDLDQYVGPARLVLATGEESFDTIADGRPVSDPPLPGEVVWRDDVGVTCRRWNWRQCVRTRITEKSTRGYFLLERLEPLPIAALESATDDLVSRICALAPEATVQKRIVSISG
jgi:DNA/RNA-binding domain of Phe-tRNA-synthetase-like protein